MSYRRFNSCRAFLFLFVSSSLWLAACGTPIGLACDPPCPAGTACDSNGACIAVAMNQPDLSVVAGPPDLFMPLCAPACVKPTPFCKSKNLCVVCVADGDCPAGQVCKVGGAGQANLCVPGCADDARCGGKAGTPGPACCGMACTDTLTDGANCGACSMPCAPANATGTCAAGKCTLGPCNAGWGDCNNDPKDGCETNLHVDAMNCGKCATACKFANGVAGCSDGCYLRSCNFGFDDCNGDPKDGCEASTLADPKNCGGCGKPCALVAHGKAGCNLGSCLLTSCDQGFADCNGNIADGCEVVTATDVGNCGMCGFMCGMKQVCTNGGCTCAMCNIPNAKTKCVNNVCTFDACLPGYADCNNNVADGCETNTQSDAKNCSACNMACPKGQSCVNSVCATCNSNILVLGDDQAAADMALVTDLNNAGLTATLVANGGINYVGQPAATNFGAVIVLVGNNYSTDMPAAGQQALVAAAAANVGMIFTEWGAYQVMSGRWQTMQSLLVLARTSGNSSTLTFTTTMNHPVWNGLPNSFKTVNSMGSNTGSMLINGGVQIASCTECNSAGVVVRDNGAGRIVQMAHAGNYMGGGQMAWTNDTNITLLMTNAAKWAARCM